MLKQNLIHPEILSALAAAGHNSKVLIADGNFPFSTKLGFNAKLVHLNLSPGIVTCTQVLEALVTAIPIQSAAVMKPASTGKYAMEKEPPIWDEFRQILKDSDIDIELEQLEIQAFYDLASSDDVALTISTGEQRIYANILLTIGVVLPD